MASCIVWWAGCTWVIKNKEKRLCCVCCRVELLGRMVWRMWGYQGKRLRGAGSVGCRLWVAVDVVDDDLWMKLETDFTIPPIFFAFFFPFDW